MSASLPQAPRWLSEGLAEFYQTVEIDFDAGDAILGRPPDTFSHPDGWPTAEELIAADGKAFYDLKRVRGFYTAAWVMVHLLMREHAKELNEYRRAIAGGEGTIQAWRTHLGADWVAWDRELRGHVRDVSDRPDVPLAARQPLPERLVRHDAVTERALDDWEVHVLWADLRPSNGAVTQADLDEAWRRAPGSAEVRFQRGRLEWLRHRLPEAEAEARAGLALRPGDPSLSLLLGWVLVEQQHRKPAAERRLDAIAPEVEALRGMTESAEALDVIAWYEKMRENFDAALDLARQAVAKEPTNWRRYDLLATIADKAQRPDDAADAAERAIALLPEQEISVDLLKDLSRFRRRTKVPVQP
jgi:tetratricopeptide (TPR) repeat protein